MKGNEMNFEVVPAGIILIGFYFICKKFCRSYRPDPPTEPPKESYKVAIWSGKTEFPPFENLDKSRLPDKVCLIKAPKPKRTITPRQYD